jgi:hypothetical protein
MNIIPQISLFGEDKNENLGDLERLKMVLAVLPDSKLIAELYKIRGNGRNDWPCEAMWNSFIASFLFEHPTTDALLRELRRNSQLRKLCGFQPKCKKQPDGAYKIYVAPSKSAYSNFLKNLMACQEELDRMFDALVEFMYENLEGFGEHLMADGKAIQSYATKLSESQKSGGRGEHDANWCKKTYTSSGENGEKKVKTVKWFGFRLHLIAEARYEMPVAFKVTKASNSERTENQNLLKTMKEEKPERIKKCEYMMEDKGYDGTDHITWLEQEGIKPIIDIRNCWKDGEETHRYQDTDLVYDYKGTVWYVNEAEERIKLAYKGYDKSTDSLRYGFKPQYQDNRIFRIKCEEDRRIFTPVARQSYKWKRLYNERSGIERMNGRIDRDYKFEKHTIRGLDKMRMFLTVSFIVYLGMAKAKIERGQKEHLCKLYA